MHNKKRMRSIWCNREDKLLNTKELRALLKSFFSFAIKYLGILAGAGIIGILLMTFSYSLPVNQSIKASSLLNSNLMGWAPLVNNRYLQYYSFFTSYQPGVLDDFTDSLILNNCFDEVEGTAIEHAADMNGYGRYWHGYVSVLRPIFHLVDYWDFLLINSFLQLFLMGCVGYGVFKATGKKRYLLAFFSSCVFLTPAATGMSLQYSPVFYISMLGSLFCLLKTDWILQKNRRYYLFLFLGILTCYFDFLTYPLLSFVFPFCWFLVAAGKKISFKSQIHLLFGGGISFIVGYGGFFVTKWIVQAAICGMDGFLSGLAKVSLHVGGIEDQYHLLHQNYCRMDTLYNNFRHYLYPVFAIILFIWIGVFIYKFLRGGLSLKCENAIFVAVLFTSPAWYLILNNHTAMHHLFTYRIYDASILGFMLLICSSIDEKPKEPFAVKEFLKRILVLILCLGLGLCASRVAKEDWTTINGGENTEILLSEGEVLEFEFTPAIEKIKNFSIMFHTNTSLEGEVVTELYDNGVICETKSVPVAEYENSVYDSRVIDWNLEPGKQYMIKVAIKDNDTGIRVLMTSEGQNAQPEYGKVFINQKQIDNVAPLSIIVYRGHMQTIPVKLFLGACSGAFLLACFLAIRVYWKGVAICPVKSIQSNS